MSRVRAWRRLVAMFFLALVWAPGAVQASPDTLRMAFSDLLEGPADVVAAPVVAGRTVVHNASEVGGEPAGPVAYGVLGSVGLTALQMGWGVARMLSGALMVVPGLLLLPFPGVDVPPEADVFSRGDALYTWKNPLGEESDLEKALIPKPVSMDAKLGITVPYSRYHESGSDQAVYPDERGE